MFDFVFLVIIDIKYGYFLIKVINFYKFYGVCGVYDSGVYDNLSINKVFFFCFFVCYCLSFRLNYVKSLINLGIRWC